MSAYTYCVLNGRLFRRQKDVYPVKWEAVPEDGYTRSELYLSGNGYMPRFPEGYEWVTFARRPGTNYRCDYYLKVETS